MSAIVSTDVSVAARAPIAIEPARSSAVASRFALQALILRDLVVLKKHFGEFVVRTVIQPFLLVFVFLYVFPRSARASAAPAARCRSPRLPRVLVPGVVAISIMFQGIQAVALQLSTEFGYTREIEDRVQAPCPIWLVAVAKVLSGAAQGLLAALIVFPIAAVIHAPGVHAHLSVHWWVVLTLIPLACVTMTALGLLLGTTFEPRNIGLMFGFVVLPLTFLGGTYYQWTRLSPSPGRRGPLAADPRARQPADLRERGHARRPDQRLAHALVRHLSGAARVLRRVSGAWAAQLSQARACLRCNSGGIGTQPSPSGIAVARPACKSRRSPGRGSQRRLLISICSSPVCRIVPSSPACSKPAVAPILT